jgi:kinetochore protein Mis12/MTW1
VKLESLLNSTIDKNFDKLEIYTLRNLLTVSNAKEDEGLENWIVLDHYKVGLSPY